VIYNIEIKVLVVEYIVQVKSYNKVLVVCCRLMHLVGSWTYWAKSKQAILFIHPFTIHNL